MSLLYKTTTYNSATLQQLWMSIIADSHDIHCECLTPFAHILDCMFPEGHSDRDKTIREIINRDYKPCHTGGKGETSHGLADTEDLEEIITINPRGEEESGFIEDEELRNLIAAADDAVSR